VRRYATGGGIGGEAPDGRIAGDLFRFSAKMTLRIFQHSGEDVAGAGDAAGGGAQQDMLDLAMRDERKSRDRND